MGLDLAGIVFDFDNTILLEKDGTGSDEIKDAVWPKVFGMDWERLKDEFPVFLKKWSGGKGSRFDIVRDALVLLKFQGDIEKEVQRICIQFNQLVQSGIIEMGVLPETRAFLETFSERLPLFINSATPTIAMDETLEKLGIRRFFQSVYGQEGGKVGGLRSALRAVGETDPKRILFVGDALMDYEAAQTVGTLFIGVATKRNGWKVSSQAFPVVTTVSEIRL